jgi:hypothetical protein
MKRNDVVLLSVCGAGLFMAGVVWRPAFGDYTKLKDAMECVSFLATTIAAVVAIYTLRAWKDQFRHAERFATLRAVKDAVTDLHLYRGHLLTVIEIFKSLRASGQVDQQLILKEELKREQLLAALSAYKKAWAAAVAFFTPEEERNFPGAPDVFMRLYLSRPSQIQEAHEKFTAAEKSSEFDAVVDSFNAEAIELFRETVSAIEAMIRTKV